MVNTVHCNQIYANAIIMYFNLLFYFKFLFRMIAFFQN